MRVLVLIVAYENHAEVAAFAEGVLTSDVLGDAVVAVCDNSAAGWPAGVMLPAGVLVVARSDNPGYLPGAVSAWRKARRAAGYGDIDWVVVCNTDLDLPSGCFERVVRDYDPSRAVVIGPRVLDLPGRVDRNPFLEQRPSPGSLLWRAALYAVPRVGFTYLWLATQWRRRRGVAVRRAAVPAPTAPARLWAPHGACMIFSPSAFSGLSEWPEAPLFSEEVTVGFALEAVGGEAFYDPRLIVVHHAHATTGPAVSLRRAEAMRTAYWFQLRCWWWSRRRGSSSPGVRSGEARSGEARSDGCGQVGAVST